MNFSGPDQEEPPGQGNSPLREGGAYQEIPPGESIAPWKAGLLADLEGTDQIREEEEERAMLQDLQEFKEGNLGDRLCMICAVFPCICTSRRVEGRIREIRRKSEHLEEQRPKEEERKETPLKRKRSVSPICEKVLCKGRQPGEDKMNPGRKKFRTSREEEDQVKVQASMSDENPQHQPLVHLDGAGATQRHQPPHHQHQGDGGEAGEEYEIKKEFLYNLVGQQPHQPQKEVFDGIER